MRWHGCPHARHGEILLLQGTADTVGAKGWRQNG